MGIIFFARVEDNTAVSEQTPFPLWSLKEPSGVSCKGVSVY